MTTTAKADASLLTFRKAIKAVRKLIASPEWGGYLADKSRAHRVACEVIRAGNPTMLEAVASELGYQAMMLARH